MKPFWKKYPEEKNKETFQAFSAETEGTDPAKTYGRTLETTDGRHNAFGKERDAAYCTGTEIGSNG